MSDALAAKNVDSPRLSAELLLAHVLGCDRLRLYMDADRPATPLERETLRTLVARALKHEPVQYLVSQAWFFSLPFHVDPRVLIPRPCTELIVEHVLQHARAEPGFAPGGAVTFADVCTGSGCIAVSLLKNLPNARAAATDLSRDALNVARLNAERHRVLDRLDLLEGDLLAPLADHPAGQHLHYLLANPPYIPDREWHSTDPAIAVGKNVKHFEPELALRGGPDGLRFIRPLIDLAPARLRPDGILLIELAASTADDVLGLAAANPLLHSPRLLNDLEGHPRVLLASRA
jgi:release factor glutamine methyltransferase